MNLKVCFFLVLVSLGFSARSQKYTLERSRVIFFSDATIEDIQAENIKTASIFNLSTSEVVFSVPISDFLFEKELMRDHFNEKYMESEKFPKAIFQGKFLNIKSDQVGEQVVKASGKLTIHGITKEVNFSGTLDIKTGQIVARSKFIIRLEDYHIKIPQLVWQNIAEEVEVTVEFYFKPQ